MGFFSRNSIILAPRIMFMIHFKVLLYSVTCIIHILPNYSSTDRQLIAYDQNWHSNEHSSPWWACVIIYVIYPHRSAFSGSQAIHIFTLCSARLLSRKAVLHPRQQHIETSISPHTRQNLAFSSFPTFASLKGIRWFHCCLYLKLSDYWWF